MDFDGLKKTVTKSTLEEVLKRNPGLTPERKKIAKSIDWNEERKNSHEGKIIKTEREFNFIHDYFLSEKKMEDLINSPEIIETKKKAKENILNGNKIIFIKNKKRNKNDEKKMEEAIKNPQNSEKAQGFFKIIKFKLFGRSDKGKYTKDDLREEKISNRESETYDDCSKNGICNIF